MSSAHKSITLHDVAKHAGVSLITASRALRDPDTVAPATIEKVQKAVLATGYIPNLLAGGLKSKRSYTVAALVPGISVSQYLPTLEELTHQLELAGYHLILGQVGYDRSRESSLLNTMLSRRVDGIVVTGLLQMDDVAERARRIGVPVVETWDLTNRPVDMVVGFSHLKVGSAVAGYFLNKGWQRLGIATADDRRAALRREGFVSTVGRDVPTAVVPAPGRVSLGRRALTELLERDPALQAIYCSSDAMAAGVLTEARARGMRVPQDLAVCGFGGADFAADLEPALTTVHIDGAAIGKQAAQLILKRCNGEPVVTRIIDVGFAIVERESTTGPRGSCAT
jgi:LacI family gluconate utilization system Gnt-I transcriptional repressor